MAPDKSILTAISKEDRELEIQRRLQDQETQKARRLLAMAAGSHLVALKLTRTRIEDQIMQVKKANGGQRK